MTAPAARNRSSALSRGLAVLVIAAGWVIAACSPVVRPAPFGGARERVTDVSLLGPFDGQVVDTNTGDPIAAAAVVGVWSYDSGDGFVGPAGSEIASVVTDQAGRYRLPAARLSVRGPTVRLVSFHLVVYKRGYVGYRSDVTLAGRKRHDFTLRHNRVELRKWRTSDSHAAHLVFPSPPPEILQLAKWEREAANLDLYRAQGGSAAPADQTAQQAKHTATLQLLDASSLLTPDDVRKRTNYTDAFDVKELEDLTRTHFYHGVHLQAVGHDEEWDVAYRVWKDPPQGLDDVIHTFKATLPDVDQSADVTAESWVMDSDEVRAVGFVDRERNVAVLLACRAKQCVDVETAIVLARFIHDNVDKLQLVDAPMPGRAAPRPVSDPAAPRPQDPSAVDGDDEPEQPDAEPTTEPGEDDPSTEPTEPDEADASDPDPGHEAGA